MKLGKMKVYFDQIMEEISTETESIDIDSCDISIEDAFRMIQFVNKRLADLKADFLKLNVDEQNEIFFFKELKPEILSWLLYFNKIHTIELKKPNGSNEKQQEHYQKELNSLTYFFDRHLDFYQYYRSNSTHFDTCYFVRGKTRLQLCTDSWQFIRDPDFSTGYDYKVAKILANEMLRIYLNQKILGLEKQSQINKDRAVLPLNNLKWTGSKVAAIELGYALHSCKSVNRGNADIKEIMIFIETMFNIDLGDYYRTYIAIRERKKDRTPFLNSLIDNLMKRMDEDDTK